MDAIRDKYNALGTLTEEKRAEQVVAFMKTFKEIVSARRTEDGNLSCMFSDKMSYTIMVSMGPTDEPKPPQEEFHPEPGNHQPGESLETIVRSLFANVGTKSLTEINTADDLPIGTNARVINCLGPVFGNAPQIVARLLKDKGYTVAPGFSGSLETFYLRDKPDVLFISAHSGLCEFTNTSTGRSESMYGIVTDEEWTQAKEDRYKAQGLFRMGYLGLAEGVYDRRFLGFSSVDKRTFCVSKEFAKDHWRFPENSAVFIHGCNSQSLAPVLTAAPVGASMFCGQHNLTVKRGSMNMAFAIDRMLGSNDDEVPPSEPGWPQRPFPYPEIEKDMFKKRLHPFKFFKWSGSIETKTVFFAGPGDFGLLAPSIKNLNPIAYSKKVEINGIFGTDPGDGNRSVTLNNTALVIEKWEKNKITVFLDGVEASPHGEMKVISRGRPSNSRWLSNWRGLFELKIKGPSSLALNADFAVCFVGDPWPYRETAGSLPTLPFVWTLLGSVGSTCTWNAMGEHRDSENKLLIAWKGGGTPSPWFDDRGRATRNTFGIGGLGDSFQKVVNFYMAIVDRIDVNEQGTVDKKPVRLGDWEQAQSMFIAKYDRDNHILGDRMVIDDEPSKLSYGGTHATLVWPSMQCRSAMPNNAAR